MQKSRGKKQERGRISPGKFGGFGVATICAARKIWKILTGHLPRFAFFIHSAKPTKQNRSKFPASESRPFAISRRNVTIRTSSSRSKTRPLRRSEETMENENCRTGRSRAIRNSAFLEVAATRENETSAIVNTSQFARDARQGGKRKKQLELHVANSFFTFKIPKCIRSL